MHSVVELSCRRQLRAGGMEIIRETSQIIATSRATRLPLSNFGYFSGLLPKQRRAFGIIRNIPHKVNFCEYGILYIFAHLISSACNFIIQFTAEQGSCLFPSPEIAQDKGC